MNDLRRLVRTIPDYPKPGILFRDVTTLFGDAEGFQAAIEGMAAPYQGGSVDAVAGIEARERAAREREANARGDTLTHDFGASDARSERDASAEVFSGTAVNRFEVPFGHLMMFFIKAVFAAVPALLLLTVLLWLFGQGLQQAFPQLLKMKILIYVPQ